ncbi:hypothetical protein BBJ28_00023778 [Nothophytophthora sp. Chile5]|nr:hypothetical protein BBJ28_00023778 [Nothophytophthora sp. Chile5]
MYSCSKCVNYHLCESCYQLGIHGFEDSRLLVDVREDFALRKVMETSKNKVPETVFTVLLKTVCRGQIDKFNFLAKWITSVVLGQPINTLEVRGIEIPHLDSETRSTLVQLLTPVLADRTDLEVCMEWFCPLPGVQRRMETIRIWVATDKDSKSPFSSKEVARDDDTESDLSPTSGSVGDVIGSPGPGSPVESPRNSQSPCSTPPPSPVRRSSTAATSESSSLVSPPRLDALSLADKVAAVEYSYEDDEDEYLSDSVKSDIAPRIVANLSPSSGQRSEAIEM